LFPIISKDMDYDQLMTLSSMVRPHVQGWNVKNATSLNINVRLLQYVLMHILKDYDPLTNFF